ncbi:Cystatin domain-containing protein [Cephalotus follicularis]|uniref:Cysteine proteinase inhibitor n=1 Tax=Cephalotus follicularis TaxID=3775 RepID=A0A1Q3BIK5_CEPFO|nr:Cystatin domain-containing protein [Cephalotus follicularis]
MAMRYLFSRVSHTSSVHAHLIKPKFGLWGLCNYNLLNLTCCSYSYVLQLHESSSTSKSGSQTETPLVGTCIYKGAQQDEWIINLAHFAIRSQNENESKRLQFVRVIGASYTMVSSILYYITLEATEAKKHNIYHAVVWMQLLKQIMELLEWKPVDDRLSALGVKRGDFKLHEAVMIHMNKPKRDDPLSKCD